MGRKASSPKSSTERTTTTEQLGDKTVTHDVAREIFEETKVETTDGILTTTRGKMEWTTTELTPTSNKRKAEDGDGDQKIRRRAYSEPTFDRLPGWGKVPISVHTSGRSFDGTIPNEITPESSVAGSAPSSRVSSPVPTPGKAPRAKEPRPRSRSEPTIAGYGQVIRRQHFFADDFVDPFPFHNPDLQAIPETEDERAYLDWCRLLAEGLD